jgi:hypothetical protein
LKDQDWLIRLRKHLGIVPTVVQKIEQPIRTKPVEMELPLASSSTGTIAGSAERIAVYRERAECGEAIFHPLDCKLIQAENLRCHAG